jgi:hypothetical protein
LRKIRIPSQGFVIIWVTSIFCGCAYKLRGTSVYLISCAPQELADVRDNFPRNQAIFADDENEAWTTAKEIAQRHRSPRRLSPTTYCQIGANVAA